MTSKKHILLGLPGLYQNWLMFALDNHATIRPDFDHNFITKQNSFQWIRKMDLDLTSMAELLKQHTVINCYVDDQNIAWYLYNFLEKTDAVGILVENIVEDLFEKSAGTKAFDGLLKHIISQYNLTPDHSDLYKRNAIIENFYLLLINQDCQFKTQTKYTHPGLVNIEWRDFEDQSTLEGKLSSINGFDQLHFESSYARLVFRNHKYIFKQKQFLSKITSPNSNFDVLETAYLGYLLWKLDSKQQDWFNVSVRETLCKDNWNDICNLANMYYNQTNDSH